MGTLKPGAWHARFRHASRGSAGTKVPRRTSRRSRRVSEEEKRGRNHRRTVVRSSTSISASRSRYRYPQASIHPCPRSHLSRKSGICRLHIVGASWNLSVGLGVFWGQALSFLLSPPTPGTPRSNENPAPKYRFRGKRGALGSPKPERSTFC